MIESERHVLSLAARQWGVFTRCQAIDLGFSSATITRWKDDGRWELVHPRVYRVVGNPVSFRQRCMAAALWAGDGAVISGLTAGRLWHLDDVTTRHIEVTVGRERCRTSIPGVSARASRHLVRLDVGEVAGIPVTSLARTVVDLAQHLDPGTLEVVLDSALRGGRTSTIAILHRAKAVAPSGRKGVGVLRELLAERRGGKARSGSALETRVRRLFVNAGLPLPVPQFRIHDRGRHVARVDFAYPEQRLVIEVKGYRWRSGRAAWLRDAIRDSEVTARGWGVITITWDEVRYTPVAAVDRVRRALTTRAA